MIRRYLPPAMLVAAVALGTSGALDRAGLEGASQGLLLGAVICAPIWLLGLWRSRNRDRDAE